MMYSKTLAAHSLSIWRAAGTVGGVAPQEAMRPGRDQGIPLVLPSIITNPGALRWQRPFSFR